MGVIVRRAKPEDAEAINEIYNYAVRELSATFHTQERSIEDGRHWLARHNDRYPVFVAEESGAVVGWASLSPYGDRDAYASTVEDSIYVHPEHWGRGIGSALMEVLMETARLLGYHAVIARIAGESEVSIRLHRRFGFEVVGILKEVGWKFDRWHDLWIMEALL
ncbi:MAG: GNAT family N-acetyltransferase [Armatimonadota bacterium]